MPQSDLGLGCPQLNGLFQHLDATGCIAGKFCSAHQLLPKQPQRLWVPQSSGPFKQRLRFFGINTTPVQPPKIGIPQ